MAEHNAPLKHNGLPERRRRTFLAVPAVPAMPKLAEVAFSTPPEDDDLPVLTEIVPPEVAAPDANSSHLDEALVSLLAADVVHAIEQQLAAELPTLIEAALLSAKDELCNGINDSLDLALRNFLAQRKQLHSPLDETGNKTPHKTGNN